MSNETDLDWLARNVHEWPESITRVYSVSNGKFCEFFPTGAKVITKDQWLARRAELQNKPIWEDAPEWSEYLVQINSGAWVWADSEDLAIEFGGSDKLEFSGSIGIVLGDWRDTLERRPRDLPDEAVTARLTEATDNVLAAVPALMGEEFIIDRNDWFERGELPPAGVECTAVADGIPDANCAIVAISTDQVVVKWTENQMFDVLEMQGWSFRPIRSDREAAVSEMMAVAAANWGNLATCCEALYDAGYRKEGK